MLWYTCPQRPRAFTLIELLIVVAIIGILAAIAIPNFMAAKTRAQVSRVMGDMNALGRSLAQYRMDRMFYPPYYSGNPPEELGALTTPTPFISEVPRDPFRLNYGHKKVRAPYYSGTQNYDYTSSYTLADMTVKQTGQFWILHSLGPDQNEDVWKRLPKGISPWSFKPNWFDPSNGLRSKGDIIYTSEKFFE